MKTPRNNQRATIIDVARHAGVAVSTASAALNGKNGKYAVSPEKSEAIFTAARQLKYEVNPHAKRLVDGGDNNTVGLFVLDLLMGTSVQKVRFIQYHLVQAGYDVPIYSAGGIDLQGPDEHAALLATLRLQQPRAIVSASTESELLPELERFRAAGGIVVTYDRPVDLDCDQVIFDREHNTYAATMCLLDHGHREIGLYTGGSLPTIGLDRFRGFAKALDEYGVEKRDEWMVAGGNFYVNTLNEGAGERVAETFLKWRRRPTAMCIVNDSAAAAFIATVQRAGVRVPEDVSVCGMDDLPIARIFPTRITTVSQPVEEIASRVAEMLFTRLRGEYAGPSRQVVIRGKLIERESVAPVSEPAAGASSTMRL